MLQKVNRRQFSKSISKKINGYVLNLFGIFCALFALDGWRNIADQMHLSLYETIYSAAPIIVCLAFFSLGLDVAVHCICDKNIHIGRFVSTLPQTLLLSFVLLGYLAACEAHVWLQIVLIAVLSFVCVSAFVELAIRAVRFIKKAHRGEL